MHGLLIDVRRYALATFLTVVAVSGVVSGVQKQGADSDRNPASAGKAAGAAQRGSATPAPAQEAVSPEVQRAIDNAIRERLRDSKVVDVETTQAIASRLSEWAKLFGFFIGIPLAILAASLGFLGFKTYKDFSSAVARARQEVLQSLNKSREDAKKVEEELLALKTQLQESSALASQVRELSQKVARIEDVVHFRATPSLTPELKEALKNTLESYYNYLKGVGLSLSLKTPTVVISEKDLNASYDPMKNRIMIHPEIAAYPDTALREFTHHVLIGLNHEWAADVDIGGVESGLADYLPSSFLGRSDFGKDLWPVFERHNKGSKVPSRNLKNNHSFAEIDMKQIQPHRYGTIWGGAFWELRESLGQEITDKLLLAAWKELDIEESKTSLKAFPLAIIHQDKILESGKYSAEIRKVFQGRKLAL
jgi:hypothetical protein